MITDSLEIGGCGQDLRDDPLNRVEVLHIKYRFPVISLENQVKLTPAPFATLMDPVVKLDYSKLILPLVEVWISTDEVVRAPRAKWRV